MEQATTITYKGPAVLERAVLAGGLAGLLLASQLLPGYPPEWRALLPLAVLALGLWSTIGAYLVSVAVLAYPIWQLSPYLMVLFIALTIIPHRLILDHLPLALLIAWSPILAILHLDWGIPLLVGVLTGSRRGALAGALVALWIKLYAAMSGNPLDLLLIGGSPGTPAAVAARFAGAGSLDTLQLIGAPFVPNSGELLASVLQVVALAAMGAAAGWLAAWGRAHLVLHDLDDPPPVVLRLLGRFAWTGLLPVLGAAAALAGALLLVPLAVGRPLSDLGLQLALQLLAAKLGTSGGAVLLIVGLVLAAQPLPAAPRRRPAPARKPAPPPVLPPVDLAPLKAGRFVPGWAAEAGLVAPLPTASTPAPDEAAGDPVEALLPGAPEEPATEPGRPPGLPERDIAIELD